MNEFERKSNNPLLEEYQYTPTQPALHSPAQSNLAQLSPRSINSVNAKDFKQKQAENLIKDLEKVNRKYLKFQQQYVQHPPNHSQKHSASADPYPQQRLYPNQLSIYSPHKNVNVNANVNSAAFAEQYQSARQTPPPPQLGVASNMQKMFQTPSSPPVKYVPPNYLNTNHSASVSPLNNPPAAVGNMNVGASHDYFPNDPYNQNQYLSNPLFNNKAAAYKKNVAAQQQLYPQNQNLHNSMLNINAQQNANFGAPRLTSPFLASGKTQIGKKTTSESNLMNPVDEKLQSKQNMGFGNSKYNSGGENVDNFGNVPAGKARIGHSYNIISGNHNLHQKPPLPQFNQYHYQNKGAELQSNSRKSSYREHEIEQLPPFLRDKYDPNIPRPIHDTNYYKNTENNYKSHIF